MGNLTDKDWSRIYSFLALELKKNPKGSPEYKEYEAMKETLEKDPVEGVRQIIEALNEDYPENKIKYQPKLDVICEVPDPPTDLMDDTKRLELCRAGKIPAKLFMRLAC